MKINIRKTIPIVLISVVAIGCFRDESQSTMAANNLESRPDPRLSSIKIIAYKGDAIKDIRKIVKNEAIPSETQEEIGFYTIGIPDLLNMNPENPDGLGWPPLPRRMLNLDQSSKWDSTIHFGVKGSFFDLVEASAGGNISIATSTTKTLVLVKNTPTNKEPLVEEIREEIKEEEAQQLGIPAYDENGDPITLITGRRPMTSDGLAYVGLCIYTTGLDQSIRAEGSVKISGNGVTEGGSWTDSIRLSQFSTFFELTGDDTITSLQNLCIDIYSRKIKESVKQDLQLLLTAASYDSSSRNARSLAIQSALHGPDIDRIKIDGHHWNIRKVNIDNQTPGIVKVSGHLKHNVRAQRDDIISFDCTYDHGERTHYNTHVRQLSATSGYRDTGRSIISDICHDAFIEFAR